MVNFLQLPHIFKMFAGTIQQFLVMNYKNYENEMLRQKNRALKSEKTTNISANKSIIFAFIRKLNLRQGLDTAAIRIQHRCHLLAFLN